MKVQEPPKGQFKTQFKTLFNYEARGDSFRVSLPEGRIISVRGKDFNKVLVNLIPFKTSSWQASPLSLPMASVNIRRKETMHDATKPQIEEIHKVLCEDFNQFWSSDIFLPEKFRKFRRYCQVATLLSDREARMAELETLLNRIKEINQQLTEYL